MVWPPAIVGLIVVINRHTHKHTDHATSAATGCIYVLSAGDEAYFYIIQPVSTSRFIITPLVHVIDILAHIY